MNTQNHGAASDQEDEAATSSSADSSAMNPDTTAQPHRKKGPLSKRITSQKTWAQKMDVAEDASRILQCETITPMEIEVSAELTNLKRLKSIAAGLKVRCVIQPPVFKHLDIDDLLDGPVYQGRSYSPFPDPQTSRYFIAVEGVWFIRLTDNLVDTHGLKWHWHLNTRPTHDVEEVISANLMSPDEADQVAVNLARLYERWPYEMFTRYAQKHRAVLLKLAVLRAAPDSQLQLLRPVQVDQGYRVQLPYIDYETGSSAANIAIILLANSIDPSLEIPLVPSNVSFHNPKRSPAETLSEELNELAAAEPDGTNFRRARKLLEYIVWKLQDRIATRDEMRDLSGRVLNLFSIRKIRLRGPYRGKALYDISKFDGDTYIEPSLAVLDDIVGDLPSNITIRIKGQSKWQLLNVLEAMNQEWFSGGGLLQTWLVGCQIADNLNISPATITKPLCFCDEALSKEKTHLCESCLSATICAELQLDEVSGSRECITCRMEAELHCTGLPAISSKHASSSLLSRRLAGLHRVECKSMQIPDEIVEVERNQMLQELSASFNVGNTWRDQYTNFDRHDQSSSQGESRRSGHPATASPDAVFPFARRGYHSVGYHCPGNIAITSNALNRLKFTYVPAILGLIRDYRHDPDAKANEMLWLARFDRVYEVGIRWPYFKRKRLALQLSDPELRQIRAEWVTLIPKKGTPKPPKSRITTTFQPPTPDWLPRGHARLKVLIGEMEEYFKFFESKLRRGPDGCPFPFAGGAMPDSWTWWNAWTFFTLRAFRMWLLCNGEWVQVDNTETIFLECLWQKLDPRYEELLTLPLVVCERHPLNCSFGHRHHGQQLRTGWTTATPSSMNDRDDSINNMLVETWISNIMKGNFAENSYSDMVADVDAIALGEDFYQPIADSDLDLRTKEPESDILNTQDNDENIYDLLEIDSPWLKKEEDDDDNSSWLKRDPDESPLLPRKKKEKQEEVQASMLRKALEAFKAATQDVQDPPSAKVKVKAESPFLKSEMEKEQGLQVPPSAKGKVKAEYTSVTQDPEETADVRELEEDEEIEARVAATQTPAQHPVDKAKAPRKKKRKRPTSLEESGMTEEELVTLQQELFQSAGKESHQEPE